MVAGAGSVGPGWGNGKAAAVLFAREGAKVFALDVALAAAEETRAVILSEGGQAVAHAGDVTSGAEVERAAQACVERFGRIDVLHNNVGGSVPGGPVELSERQWDDQIAFNLKSAYLTLKHVLPVMERQGAGSIVNVSSICALRYIGYDQMAYDAAKAGMLQLTRSVALRYANTSVRCNAVAPGFIRTPAVVGRMAGEYGLADPEALFRALEARVPMGRVGDAWDVAYAALYLASDESKYVTGIELVIDGGLTARCA
ncbi:MAG: SDR family NAD(P)-dependent oxidoreductase [Alphaproteobacteria bacterium]